MLSSSITPVTKAPQARIGIRPSVMPAVRSVSAVVTTQTAPSSSDTTTRASDSRYRSTASVLPPPGPPLAA